MGGVIQDKKEMVLSLGKQLLNYSMQKIAQIKHSQASLSWKIMI